MGATLGFEAAHEFVVLEDREVGETTEALEDFAAIVPCGIRGRGVTSLSQELAREVPMAEVETRAARHFATVLGAELTFVDEVPLQ